MRTYKKIAEISFMHSYYKDKEFANKDIMFIPTSETERILNNYRILVKLKKSKIELIHEYDKEDDIVEPLISINKELKFTFLVKQINQNIITFSDIPFLSMSKQILYFSNKKKEKNIKSGELSEEKYITHKDVRTLLPKGVDDLKQFTHEAFKLLNYKKEILAEFEANTDSEDIEKAISQLPSGYYQIKTNKKNKEFVINKMQSNSGMLAYIDIFLDQEITKEIDKENPYKFKIEFKPREIFWQYNIIEKYNKIKNLKIIDEQTNIKFDYDKSKEPKDEKKAVFLSKTKLPMMRFNTFNFKLVSKNGSSNYDKILFEKLPAPKISDIIKHPKIDKEFILVKDIYI